MCDGGSLYDLLHRGDITGDFKLEVFLSEDAIRYVIVQVLRALVYLHAKKISHRDIKGASATPARRRVLKPRAPGRNILMSRSGDLKLTDFGISNLVRMHTPAPARANALTV